MKTMYFFVSVMFVSLMGFGGQAYATSWIDSSPQTGSVTITSTNFNNATVLRRVIATCPKNGYLTATADAGFSLRPTAVGNRVWVRYSIAIKTGIANGIDPNHYRNLQEFVMDPTHSSPGGMFRVDKCKAGQTVTYVFLGQRVQNAAANTFAWQPRLKVEFFDQTI